MASASNYEWKTESYEDQKKRYWPEEGRHILAQYDEDSVVLYQAFNPQIAEYAVKHQRFGGDFFSFDRMSWIKTNFLWMMFRCGWASKTNQEHVLAVRITKEGFEQILAEAYTVGFQKSRNVSTQNIQVRLQWDPDHSPSGDKETRRTIQLGLKKEILRNYGTKWILQIDDITEFVKEQRAVLEKGGTQGLSTASERVYPVTDVSIASRIQLDFYEEHHKHPVVVDSSSHADSDHADSTS